MSFSLLFYSISFGFIFLYLILIYLYKLGFTNYPSYTTSSSSKADIWASIIISARNPNENLQKLIVQLNSQINSDKIEIIIVDDFSDNEILHSASNLPINYYKLRDEKPNLSNLKNNKKEAISLAVEKAKNEYIVCLDSDVILDEKWWLIISNFIVDNNPKFAAGFHRYIPSKSFLNQFLCIEQDILTASSIAALQFKFPTMCNGANMVFSKSAFLSVNGYKGLYQTNGGDDLFLYHRIYAQFPSETFYVKNLGASVSSEAPRTKSNLFKQRSRWIEKSTSYENVGILIQSIIIFLTNLICTISIFLPTLLPIFILKIFMDIWFILSIKSFYRFVFPLNRILYFMILYPLYVMSVFLIFLIKKIVK